MSDWLVLCSQDDRETLAELVSSLDDKGRAIMANGADDLRSTIALGEPGEYGALIGRLGGGVTDVNLAASSGLTPSGSSTPLAATRSDLLAVMPPASSSRTTFSRRGRVNAPNVDSSSSHVTHLRPIFWATAAVVPEPAKQSSTMSPGFVAMWMICERRRSGLGVSNGIEPGKSSLRCCFALRVVSTSSASNKLVGIRLSGTSDLNRLNFG